MKKPLFTGVCTALVTPFWANSVNYPMVDQLLKRQVEAGIKAVVLAGTTGEAPTLTDQEKAELFRRGKDYVGDRCKIIAGTGCNSTAHAIVQSINAEKAGADAMLVVAPYYNKGNEEGLYAHFAAIAAAVSIPVIVYNVPSRTGVDIPISVYKRLSAIPHIGGIKEAGTDIIKITKIRQACGNDMPIWSGNDDQTVPAIALGASGVISVVSNLFPEEAAAMADAALAGDLDTASELQLQLQPYVDALFSEVNPIPVKYALGRMGYDCGGYRLPLCTPSPAVQKKLDLLLP